ncbi:MAG: hypothetical protein JWQ81_8576 [Amycolatopsis sp.]|nr:hypothetical protein [Amycolatopsis sp.]
MSHRKHRVHGRNGLFEFALEGGITEPPSDNPLTRPCATCRAPAGQRCRRPRPRRGWTEIPGYHDARTQTPQENP